MADVWLEIAGDANYHSFTRNASLACRVRLMDFLKGIEPEEEWRDISTLDKSEMHFVEVYNIEQEVMRMLLWSPSRQLWELPYPHGMESPDQEWTHYKVLPPAPETSKEVLP